MSLSDIVCDFCGVPVAKSGSGAWVHVDELPEKTAEHTISVTSRREYLFGQSEKASVARAPSVVALERQADAMERIADALEQIATVLATNVE